MRNTTGYVIAAVCAGILRFASLDAPLLGQVEETAASRSDLHSEVSIPDAPETGGGDSITALRYGYDFVHSFSIGVGTLREDPELARKAGVDMTGDVQVVSALMEGRLEVCYNAADVFIRQRNSSVFGRMLDKRTKSIDYRFPSVVERWIVPGDDALFVHEYGSLGTERGRKLTVYAMEKAMSSALIAHAVAPDLARLIGVKSPLALGELESTPREVVSGGGGLLCPQVEVRELEPKRAGGVRSYETTVPLSLLTAGNSANTAVSKSVVTEELESGLLLEMDCWNEDPQSGLEVPVSFTRIEWTSVDGLILPSELLVAVGAQAVHHAKALGPGEPPTEALSTIIYLRLVPDRSLELAGVPQLPETESLEDRTGRRPTQIQFSKN